ncbi:hypothetical protein JCM10914A_41300 [Paenibacillus sp. JCM 10914]
MFAQASDITFLVTFKLIRALKLLESTAGPGGEGASDFVATRTFDLNLKQKLLIQTSEIATAK